MTNETYIGIDPGASGGIAVLHSDGGIQAEPMPKTETDLWDFIHDGDTTNVFAIVEQVGGFVGGKGQPGSAMFKFGQNYGSVRMALVAAKIPFETVAPQVWQSKLGIQKRSKGEAKSKHKSRLKSKAQQLFPNEKVTLQTADALLLMEYLRRKRTGTL